MKFKMSRQKMIKGSICPFQHLEKDFKNYKFSEQCISKAKLMNYEVCRMFKIAAFFRVVRQVMLSLRSGKHVTCSLKHEAVKHVVEIPFRNVGTVTEACSNTGEFFRFHTKPLSGRGFTNTEVSSTDGEQNKAKVVTDESSERKTTSVRSFQRRWLRDHTWLRFENGAMFCHFCCKSKKTNPFVEQISEHQLFRGIKIARITKMLFMKRPCEIRSATNSAVL